MRKSPNINPRLCQRCGKKYKPSGNGQKFCSDCKIIKEKERKKEWYRKKYPDSKPKHKCTENCCICGGEFYCHYDGKAYCNRHYQSMIRYGHPNGQERKSTNRFEINGDVLKIITKKGDIFLADADDLEKIEHYSWCLSKTGYAVANIGGKVVKMHRYIMGVKDAEIIVDHKNRDTHDNRKNNLRLCDFSDNARNKSVSYKCKSGYLGIRRTKSKKYNARITVNRKEIYLGVFDTLEEAIEARAKAEDKYHGEFGSHNA